MDQILPKDIEQEYLVEFFQLFKEKDTDTW